MLEAAWGRLLLLVLLPLIVSAALFVLERRVGSLLAGWEGSAGAGCLDAVLAGLVETMTG